MLTFLCGKMGAGKSPARALAQAENTVLFLKMHGLPPSILQIKTPKDYKTYVELLKPPLKELHNLVCKQGLMS